MKKLISVLLIVSLICCMFCIPAMARNYIISPEHDNIVPPDPVVPSEPETPETPVTPTTPVSPQTGGLNIVVYMVLAVLLCGTAVVTWRKAVVA